MASSSNSIRAKLEKIGLLAGADQNVPIFEGVIDMQGTLDLHVDAFQDQIQYMNDVVAQYVVQLPDSTLKWVPVDLIRHLYHADKSFRLRLSRFLKGLTSSSYKVVDDDTVYELGVGNVGNTFLSWDMTITLFLQEARGVEKKKGKAKNKEVTLVKESKGEVEEVLSDVAEASMALVLLQEGSTEDSEPHRDLEGDEIVEEVPELDVTTLNPIIVDDKEFLFLDDICKSLGLREDEALSIITIGCSFCQQDTPDQPGTGVQIDFDDNNLSKALAIQGFATERTIQESVSNALVEIESMKEEYESVPEEAFQPHKRIRVDTSIEQRGSSIDICNPRTSECDDDIEKAFIFDKYAARGSGVREQSDGRDTSLIHYLPSLSPSIIRVIHLEYSEEAQTELLKCKALSWVLTEDGLASNANKCILISREAALYAFASNYTGHVLRHCAAFISEGVTDPSVIASSLGEKATQNDQDKEDIQNLLAKM